MINYKNTLNLPNTNFSMKGNLFKKEIQILDNWNKKKLYQIIRKVKKGRKLFFLHDGPPYANGNIHIGHAVNKIIKDIIIKYKGLTGYDAPYIPGWDCHGLPIELKVEKIIGKPKEKCSVMQFQKTCRKYAINQVKKQKEDFVRLGVLGEWEQSYLTMDFNIEANIIRTFKKIVEQGNIYRGIKPVHWCVSCKSALADSEIEYFEKESPSLDLSFLSIDSINIARKFNLENFFDPIYFLVWTTTPWTLPANQALAIHPDFFYELVEIHKKNYVIASDLVESTMKRIQCDTWKVLGKVKGKKLKNFYLYHPFMDFKIPIILSKHVTLDIGTGIVHIAPSHGYEDYLIGKIYKLENINLINKEGKYYSGILPILDNLNMFQANKKIVELLNKNNNLLKIKNFFHPYPHCWRHNIPLVFRTTPQWFINMDKFNLRNTILQEIKNVEWIPSWGKKQIRNMVFERLDWCISRQRIWGVPMSLFIHNKTKKLHPNTIELMEKIAQKVEKEGIEAWWNIDSFEMLGKDVKNYHKVLDTLDVWFDSGSTHYSFVELKNKFKEDYQSDIYVEGLDQYRGWFMSSLITSVSIRKKAPYRQVLTHSFVVDKHKKKMSKSAGNVISPQKIINKFGADILRLWVASTDYFNEMILSDEILEKSVEIYRKIRNTARFLLANLNQFHPDIHIVHPKDMVKIDVWAVRHTKKIQELIIYEYENYNFHNVIKYILQFCSTDMSAFYLEIVKDRQYTFNSNSIARRSCQTAMYYIIESLVRWISPILSFTSDEIWNFIPGKRSEFIFTEEWYCGYFKEDIDKYSLNDKFWKILLQIKKETNKIIEKARKEKYINSSLEANLVLYASPKIIDQISIIKDEICFALLVSSVKIKKYVDSKDNLIECQELKGLKITLEKSNEEKCLRCWNYRNDIGKNLNFPKICERCINNIVGPGEVRKFI